MPQPEDAPGPPNLPTWKTLSSHISAFVLAAIFLISGLWKVVDPLAAAVRMTQAQFPAGISLPVAILVGTMETFTAVLLLVPRFRRWGAYLAALALVAFMVYIGYYYHVLRGEECNCFPWIKRMVNVWFFLSDALMVGLAVVAGWWGQPSRSKRSAAVILAAVGVFALASYGISAVRQRGVAAPEFVTVEGKHFDLHRGRVFIYVFDPECSHCDQAARTLAKLDWGDTKLIAMATRQQQFAVQFVQETGLKAGVSNDLERLKSVFTIPDPPFAIALDGGYQKSVFSKFDEQEPAYTLRQLGFVH
jgi:uncharacterized membrane protein YphA (DoxX/SURF4 family)